MTVNVNDMASILILLVCIAFFGLFCSVLVSTFSQTLFGEQRRHGKIMVLTRTYGLLEGERLRLWGKRGCIRL